MKCPGCKSEMVDRDGICSDGDLDCDCDRLFYCEKCDESYVHNCPAHPHTVWSGCKSLPNEIELAELEVE